MSLTKFNGYEGSLISLDRAQMYIMNFKRAYPSRAVSFFYGENIILRLLAAPECIGIRILNGLDENGKDKILLVGVKANGENLLPGSTINLDGEEIIIADTPFVHPLRL